MRARSALLALLAPAAFVAVLAVRAAPLAAQQVTLTASGTVVSTLPGTSFTPGPATVTFLLDASPTPTLFGPNGFDLNPVTGVFAQGGTNAPVAGDLSFSALGQLEFVQAGAGLVLLNSLGSQLYTGSPSAPTFALGTFAEDFLPPLGAPFRPTSVTIARVDAKTTAPEPAAWALLGTGMLAVAGTTRRRSA